MGNLLSRVTTFAGKFLTPVESIPSTSTTLDVLPAELILKIGESLTFKEKVYLATTSKYYHGLFQPEIRAAKLLKFVVRGEQDHANTMPTPC